MPKESQATEPEEIHRSSSIYVNNNYNPNDQNANDKDSRKTMHWKPHRHSTEIFTNTEDQCKETPLATPRNVFISVPFSPARENPSSVSKKERERSSTVHDKKHEKNDKNDHHSNNVNIEQLLQVIKEKDAVISQMESKNKELETKLNQLITNTMKPKLKFQEDSTAANTTTNNNADKAMALVEQLKVAAKAHRKNNAIKKPVILCHRNGFVNNSRSDNNILLKSSPDVNEIVNKESELLEKRTCRQSLPSSTKASGAKKIVFYDLPCSPNPRTTRAQLESFKKFHSTGPLQRARNSISGETAGACAVEGAKMNTKAKGAMNSARGLKDKATKKGRKEGRSLKAELNKLRAKIFALVQVADGQGRLLKKLGFI